MEEQLTLTQLIEPVDDIDKFLMEDVLMLVQNTNILPVVSFWGHNKLSVDKTDELFLKKIVLCVNSLIKANANRRNYEKIKNNLVKEIKRSDEIKGTRIDILFNKVDAFVIIENFLSQIKTSLDLLAQSLKPIYNVDLHTWGKKKDPKTNKDLSGIQVVSVLTNNVKQDIQHNTKPIVDLINLHAESITKIINLRDSAIHYGTIKKIQGFRYSVSKNDVFPPIIALDKTDAIYVHDYMNEVMKYISEFIQEFIITLLSNLLPDMVVKKKPSGEWILVSLKSLDKKPASAT